MKFSTSALATVNWTRVYLSFNLATIGEGFVAAMKELMFVKVLKQRFTDAVVKSIFLKKKLYKIYRSLRKAQLVNKCLITQFIFKGFREMW